MYHPPKGDGVPLGGLLVLGAGTGRVVTGGVVTGGMVTGSMATGGMITGGPGMGGTGGFDMPHVVMMTTQ